MSIWNSDYLRTVNFTMLHQYYYSKSYFASNLLKHTYELHSLAYKLFNIYVCNNSNLIHNIHFASLDTQYNTIYIFKIDNTVNTR